MALAKTNYNLETKMIHAGQKPDESTGAIMPPIHLSSTFAQSTPGKHQGFEYSRTGNPTRAILEKNLASLEGAKFGFCFSSGCAAASAIFSMLSSGDHVVCGNELYGGTYRLATEIFSKLGIRFVFADLTDTENLAGAINPKTKLIWLETPTNPLLKLTDIAKLCRMANRKKIPVAVDNTFATPYLQSPISLGASLSVHSTTKYLSGHSDVVGGAVLTSNKKLAQKLALVQNSAGAVPGPFDCFLVLRGIKTLHLRMDRHNQNAMSLAKYLEKHTFIKKVIYPGLKSHPQFQLAKKQMSGFGGMVSFEVKGGKREAFKLLKSLKLFTCAESLGGVESLAGHPASMTHAAIPKDIRNSLGISEGLIRLSVGVESIMDLENDLRCALRATTK